MTRRLTLALIVLLAAAWPILLVGQGRPSGAHRPAPAPDRRIDGGRHMVTIPAASPQLRQIRTQAVAAEAVSADEVVAPGRIAVDPRRAHRVVLPVGGRVARVMVRIGDSVRPQQPLLAVDSPEAETAMSECRQAQAGVTQATGQVRRARADLDRLRDLLEHKAVARKDVLHAEQDLAQAEAELEQAEAHASQARRRMEILGLTPGTHAEQVVVRAAIAGKVLELNVTAGEYRNDTTETVMTIADLSTVLVTSEVAEREIRLVTTGEQVAVELVAYPGETFSGRVTRIADTVDPRTRTIQVEAEIANAAGRLRPEMFGRIRHSHAPRSLPVVPAQAIVHGAEGTAVFVEHGPGLFERRAVVAGHATGGQTSILRGLQPGDRVVVDGAMLLTARRAGAGL